MDNVVEVVYTAAVLNKLILDQSVLDQERDNVLDQLVYNRTERDVELNTTRGNYNVDDMRRVENAVTYIADMLRSYGYTVNVSDEARIWELNSLPRLNATKRYCADIIAISKVFPYGLRLGLPSSLDKLNITKANNIEKMLATIGKLTENIPDTWYYSNELEGGVE